MSTAAVLLYPRHPWYVRIDKGYAKLLLVRTEYPNTVWFLPIVTYVVYTNRGAVRVYTCAVRSMFHVPYGYVLLSMLHG